MTPVHVVTDLAAPVARVWRALISPPEVQAWDGAEPVDVPNDYPRPGQNARWLVSVAGRRATLYDHVRVVETERTLQSEIAYGFVRLDETYVLWPTDIGTRVLTTVSVSATRAGLGRLARAVTARTVRHAMARLQEHCERDSAG